MDQNDWKQEDRKVKVSYVIHGFPPYYMAGSEVYTYEFVNELKKYAEVSVFTRLENPYKALYSYSENIDNGVHVFRVNKPSGDYTLENKYLDTNMDKVFREYLKKTNPDLVHIGHLSHLSTNIVNIAKEEFDLPVVLTAHDFWMHCVRGQLLTRDLELCTGPERNKCVQCLSYLRTDIVDIDKYLTHMDRVMKNIDIILVPSRYLYDFYLKQGIPEHKLVYSKYGFRHESIPNLRERHSIGDSGIRFGYMGRIIPAKGIHILLMAFNEIDDMYNAKLNIWGDPGKDRLYLKEISGKNVNFMGGFHHNEIGKVLSTIDVLVVPSIWYENSPLVIQEAFLAGIPVITSDIGGMAELVSDGVNGFLFKMGDPGSLYEKMMAFVKNPELINEMRPDKNEVRDIKEECRTIYDGIYRRLVDG